MKKFIIMNEFIKLIAITWTL